MLESVAQGERNALPSLTLLIFPVFLILFAMSKDRIAVPTFAAAP